MPAELLVSLFIIFIQAAGIPFPVPGSLLLVEAGRRYHWALPTSIAIILLASVAGFLGSLVLFALARSGGTSFLAKYGERMGATPARMDSTRKWLDGHGRFAIFLGRLLPGMRTATGLLAGIVRVSWLRYGVAAGFAALAWSALYYSVGSLIAARLALLIGMIVGITDAVPQWLFAPGLAALTVYAGSLAVRKVRSKRLHNQTNVAGERITSRQKPGEDVRPPAGPGGGPHPTL